MLSWAVARTLASDFCSQALPRALQKGAPEICHTAQGVPFTSRVWTEILPEQAVQSRRDGRGRAVDNRFVEGLWRRVKYEEVYLPDYADVRAAEKGLSRYCGFYNTERRPQSLAYKTPAAVYAQQA